jgi:hypothetical protein
MYTGRQHTQMMDGVKLVRHLHRVVVLKSKNGSET